MSEHTCINTATTFDGRPLPPCPGCAADGIPRRIRIDLFVPAERAIYDAVQAVEAMPPDVRLTNAVNKLAEARALVADFVDGVPDGEGYPRPAPPLPRDAEGEKR